MTSALGSRFRMRSGHVLFVLLSILFASFPAAAQTPDPHVIEFEPSPDHNRVENGIPLVDRYWLEFYVAGSGAVLQAIDLGKPTADGDGIIRVDFGGRLGPWRASGIVYEARVVAAGIGGLGPSGATNTFTFPTAPPPAPNSPAPAPEPATCTYDLSPMSRTLGPLPVTDSLLVTTGDGCPWTPSSSESWLRPNETRPRTGSGGVTFNLTQNASASSRIASLRIGTATFVVTQTGTCGYTVTPSSQGFSAAGGTGTIAVTASPGCDWTAVRAGSWISITSGASGSANGTVRYRVSANAGSSARTGTLTIGGNPITIIQSAGAAPNPPAGTRVVIIR
jgi:hypothetical protein